MAAVVPFVRAGVAERVHVSPDLRRAVEYREGRTLTDYEAEQILVSEIDVLLARWAALGRWITAIDAWTPRVVPTKPWDATHGTHSRRWPRVHAQCRSETRAKMSAAQRARWARQKAAGGVVDIPVPRLR
jgi:hypothetical protein